VIVFKKVTKTQQTCINQCTVICYLQKNNYTGEPKKFYTGCNQILCMHRISEKCRILSDS